MRSSFRQFVLFAFVASSCVACQESHELAPGADAGPDAAIDDALHGACVVQGERVVADGARFFDGCNACVCAAGSTGCNNAACASPPSAAELLDGGGTPYCEPGGDSDPKAPGYTWTQGEEHCRCSAIGDIICTPLTDGSCVSGERLIPNGLRFFDGCDACRCANGELTCTTGDCASGSNPVFCVSPSGDVMPGATWTEGDRSCRCSTIGDVICR